MRKFARVPRKPKRKLEPRNDVLERLKEITTQLGVEVREERLTREVGQSVRGGLCRVEEREIVLLDRNVDPEARIDTLCSVLAARDLESVYIEPELRRMIGGAAAEPSALEATADAPGSAQPA